MKYYITKEATPHGAISWSHDGKDDQYCEAGEVVTLDWQPSAGWGLQEAHYTDSNNAVTSIDLTPVVINGKKVVQFTMPASNIVIGATFKRFVVQDWTDGDANENSEVFVKGVNGEPMAVTVDVLAAAMLNGDNDIAAKENIVEVQGATATLTPNDNTIYNCGELSSLDLTLPTEYGVDFMSQINFTSGTTATTLTDDNDINWLGDDVDGNGDFVPAASKRYVVLIYSDGVDMRGVVTATTPLA